MNIELHRINVPDNRSFHGGVIPYEDKYICIYHNSEYHRIGSCFVELDSLCNFNYIDNTHTEDLKISTPSNKYIDPRIFKYNNQFLLSLSQLNNGHEKICLFLLDVVDKIIIKKHITTFGNIERFTNYNSQREKNWTPWQYNDKLLYTYSLNPHRILEVDINNTNSVKLISETSWKSDLWWDKQQWVEPKYRLNSPPVLLPDGTYLSVFHTMCMSSLATPWHRIQPNNLLSYWTGFFQFEGKFPFRVLKISNHPFMAPDFILPDKWEFHPPPSGGNPFYPFSMMLIGEKIILTGGSNEIAVASCSIPLMKIIDTLSYVQNI